MTGQPVTTNPLLIMVINMTIVFGVLFLLGYVIKFIHWIDPTRKKEIIGETNSAPPVQPVETEVQEPAEDKELVAVVTTAIMAYGYKNVKIKSIQKI